MELDEVLERRGTTSVKWNHLESAFGCREDALPLWVADMDFTCADPILKALRNRLNHPIFGYEDGYDEEYVAAVTGWFDRHFHWKLGKDDLFFSPGVVPAISFLIDMLSEEGDGIIIQSPVYHPFAAKIIANNRVVVENPLNCNQGVYTMDFEDLEAKLQLPKVKGIILCNPHNPVGRVWNEKELIQFKELAKRYQKWIISDEIHCDLMREGYHHTPLVTLCDDYRDQIITCTAPSKTFNLAGLQNSNIIIHNEAYRELWRARVKKRLSISECNTFGRIATIAAYNDGEAWLHEVNAYIDGNVQYLQTFLKERLPLAVMSPCEGTYLAWVDFRAYAKDEHELENKIRKQANVVFNEGYLFGEQGKGFERINLACPRIILEACMKQVEQALLDRGQL